MHDTTLIPKQRLSQLQKDNTIDETPHKHILLQTTIKTDKNNVF